MTDIDYEALAEIIDAVPSDTALGMARAVVAAYQEQQRARGVVEVRRDALGELYEEAIESFSEIGQAWRENAHPNFLERLDSIESALATAEDPNG